MACGFKFCRSGGKCFLEGVSPCSNHLTDESDIRVDASSLSRRMRQMGLSRTGFLHSTVLDETGFADPFYAIREMR